MVKSSSRPRKTSKFVIDLGPEIDRVVKKKNVKIKKQKVVILGLQKECDELRKRKIIDLKTKKQKFFISSLEQEVNTLTRKLSMMDTELRQYKVRRVTISNKTVNNAFKNLRDGKSLSKMHPNTMLLIQQSGRWDEARKISAQMKLC
jgi:hypothetical protein|tara:strand:+ start:85 stop:525 length:441 start_codon:yes stop_codon:yes gene_type:complete